MLCDIAFLTVSNLGAGERIIITVYEPDPSQWDREFCKRLKP
jgi:hypothetical protein